MRGREGLPSTLLRLRAGARRRPALRLRPGARRSAPASLCTPAGRPCPAPASAGTRPPASSPPRRACPRSTPTSACGSASSAAASTTRSSRGAAACRGLHGCGGHVRSAAVPSCVAVLQQRRLLRTGRAPLQLAPTGEIHQHIDQCRYQPRKHFLFFFPAWGSSRLKQTFSRLINQF
ncbi:hypothetical protein GQ55_5G414800 [Panicum hallii var. hallii]|uniref:Uncharacterized protein n=1 Tax=Panicum hallii var. hallii TaxID=1504633 RepID=A0A2T7DNU0_9POAL|nr:hypothetical protein GQ55_5G414800 [Panicum hallii var. hallii]